MSLLFCIVSVYAITIYCKCVRANKILSIVYCLIMNTEEKSVLTTPSNIYSEEHEIAWLSFLLWTRGGLHITVP